MTSQNENEAKQWQDAIVQMDTWLSDEFTNTDEEWTILDQEYIPEHHRLVVEFDDCFQVMFRYDVTRQTFHAMAYDQNFASLNRNSDNMEEEIRKDDEITCWIDLTYTPACDGQDKSLRTLMLKDPEWDFSFMTLEQATLFFHLLDKLIEFGKIKLDKPFYSWMIIEYVRQQQILKDTHEMMRAGMVSDWQILGTKWNELWNR